MSSKHVTFAKVGLALLGLDMINRKYHETARIVGLGSDREIPAGKEALGWTVDHALQVFPCQNPEVWAEVLERARRIQGELTKIEAALKRASKSFPRNTTKEPL